MIRSQEISEKTVKKLKLDKQKPRGEEVIRSQKIGTMLDDIGITKVTVFDRVRWLKRDMKGFYHDFRYIIINHIKWHKTLSKIRPWEGFDGVLEVMQNHLKDYIGAEEKYGISVEEHRQHKIKSAKATVILLKRLQAPDTYWMRRVNELKKKYPKYKSLISNTNYGTSYNGSFLKQGNGWAGYESGKNPREGYFEFINSVFTLTESPNQNETDKIISRMKQYHIDYKEATKQGKLDKDRDMQRLFKILENNFYSWWD